jgi:C-terminal processing protease CtpA/Prc
MAMKACPKLTTLGETTLGILSDNLYKRLPNGWEISLSNEVYEAPNGRVYEAIGIAPDVEALVFDPKGFGVAVDRALDLIQSRVTS